MKNAVVIGTLGIGLSLAMLAFGYLAGSGTPPVAVSPSMASSGTEPLNRSAIQEIVREYLIENPDILVEVQQALETRQEEQQRLAQVETIRSATDTIFRAKHDGLIGNPDGRITIVEFFDYNCGFCKRALADMDRLVSDNPDLRFVMKEFPILGPDSQKAHQVSMAFRALAPGKYDEFHRRLLGAQGRANEAAAIRVATSLGVAEADLRAEMQNPDIGAAFNETYELANKLAITGTPSYVIGEEVIFGAMGHQLLSQKIEATRALCGETATC